MHTLLPLKIQMVGPKCEGLVLGRALLARMLCSELALHPPAGALSLFLLRRHDQHWDIPRSLPPPLTPPPPPPHTHTLSVSCTYFHKLSNKIFHFKTLLTLPYPPPPPPHKIRHWSVLLYYCDWYVWPHRRQLLMVSRAEDEKGKTDCIPFRLSSLFFATTFFFSLQSEDVMKDRLPRLTVYSFWGQSYENQNYL